MLPILAELWDWPSNHDYFTATGTIVDSRIVVDAIRETQHGGFIFYRIEARVQYEIGGQPQDRWLTASESTSTRPLLEAMLASHPKTCLVYWPPGHPENARCRLKQLDSNLR